MIIFSNASIWNPNFAAELNNAMGLQNSPAQDIWMSITTRFVLIIIAIGLIDPLTVLYKSIKYRI